MDEHGVHGKEIVLTVLDRTVEKGPLMNVGEDSSASVKQPRNKQYFSRSGNVFYGTTLRWVLFDGSIPKGAVSIWNDYTNRQDYTCMERGCGAGYYHPSYGPYCYYPESNREHGTSVFWLLVNEYNFESLTWKPGSNGYVPHNSINTCPGVDVYVGKNHYGLGKVVTKHSAFFLGHDGKEYWYKNYDVLTINKDYLSQKISNVKYIIEQGTYSNQQLTLFFTKVTNNHCASVKKSTTLSKTVSFEHNWEFDITLSTSVSTTATLGIPEVIGMSWGGSSEKSYSWTNGFTQTETNTYSETVEVEVPPNHSCEVAMEGIKMTAKIPFTATVTHHYNNGEKKSATTRGVSDNVVLAQVHTVVKRCEPIESAVPCQS
ncbi:natterin-3-like [Sceloporus undulatus]|uniref:natterin-3-like n=1 Tax=Sceloporus undulatus TaxID=8520 RepID=UPI001C4BBD78|nr:natterin-3-like [Sceloporus undulatus]